MMQKYRNLSFSLLIALFVSANVQAKDEEIVVIGSKDFGKVMTTKQLKILYMAKEPDLVNKGVIVANYPTGDAVRERFYVEFFNKSPEQMTAYWSRMRFSGKAGNIPEVMASCEEVKAWVVQGENRLGYITLGCLDDEVAIVQVVNSKQIR